jgi:hypothetical protein
MKSPAEWMADIEASVMADAPERSHVHAVTGRVRIDCVRERNSTVVTWFVNNTPATPEQVQQAVAWGRAHPQKLFAAKG